MASPVREHRAPRRYSLTTEQARRLGAFLERHGGITSIRIDRFSTQFGCARKTVHEQVERLGFEVTQVARRETAAPRIEDVFPDRDAEAAPRVPDPASDSQPVDEEMAILAAEEVRLRDEHDRREAELLAAIAELEDRIRDRETQLEQDRAAVRKYMSATKELRAATRSDRDVIDTLRDENTVLKMRNRRLSGEMEQCRDANGRIKDEMRNSMARERTLLSELQRLAGISNTASIDLSIRSRQEFRAAILNRVRYEPRLNCR